MFGSCPIIENPFGSRDPLRPSIASLGEESTLSPDKAANGDVCRCIIHLASNLFNQRNPGFEQHVDINLPSLLQDTSSAAPKPICYSMPSPNPSTTLGPSSTNAKESDVAAFDSIAVQPALAPTHRKHALPRSVLASIMKDPDILDALMLNCPDFQTLLALVTSCKTAKRAFEQHPVGIIKEMLKTMPQELQDLTTALIGINGCHIGTSRSIERHMEIWLGMRPKPLMGRFRVCTSELKTDT